MSPTRGRAQAEDPQESLCEMVGYQEPQMNYGIQISHESFEDVPTPLSEKSHANRPSILG